MENKKSDRSPSLDSVLHGLPYPSDTPETAAIVHDIIRTLEQYDNPQGTPELRAKVQQDLLACAKCFLQVPWGKEKLGNLCTILGINTSGKILRPELYERTKDPVNPKSPIDTIRLTADILRGEFRRRVKI